VGFAVSLALYYSLMRLRGEATIQQPEASS